jgi:Pvc16 N-terminal domain
VVLIDQLLKILQEKLEALLQAARSDQEKWIILENPVTADGSPTDSSNNKIVMSLLSIQADSSTGAFTPPAMGRGDLFPLASPPLHLDVYFLLAANFPPDNYTEGVGMMSRIISYFQEKPVFTHADTPKLPDEMDRLAIEFVSLDFTQANNVATLAGLKRFPFLLYRIRRVPFAGPAIAAAWPAIGSAEPEAATARSS